MQARKKMIINLPETLRFLPHQSMSINPIIATAEATGAAMAKTGNSRLLNSPPPVILVLS